MELSTALEQPSFVGLAKTVAERTSPLIAWIGAGLSAGAGIPSWLDLRGQLHQSAVHKANTMTEGPRLLAALTSIAGIKDPWIAFERLYEVLGVTTFTAEVRRLLDTSDKTPPPIYKMLTRLPLRGILNLNIDSFGNDTIRKLERPPWKHFTGRDAPRMTHVLKSLQPFSVQLHGSIDEQTSWIFRRSELEARLAEPGYINFINSIVSTHTIIFIGISADDIAAGGFLERLSSNGVSTGPHYWFTHRSDTKSDKWAELAGIQIIRYSKESNHQMLGQLVEELTRYISLDEPTDGATSTPSPIAIDDLLEPALLLGKPLDEIRRTLHTAVSRISASDHTALRAFLKKYIKCISLAWISDPETSDDLFFGRKLEASLGEGAFGSVYQSTNSAGAVEAVKILHQDVFKNIDMFNSFRRGVRSMKYLTAEGISGVVKSIDAYEMPPSVVMEYVPGLSLLEAMDQRHLSNWLAKLDIASRLATIVHDAHQSSHRVLHRDLRPHNIILRNFFSGDDEIDVVVLDFDLSWHKDSLERSIYPRIEGALGYAAPEQFASGIKGRTRSALVDCFGLGMTMFYLAMGRHPQPREQDSQKWTETLNRDIAMQPCADWHSLPVRYARLISDLTKSEQDLRIDFTLASLELRRILNTANNQDLSTSVLAEELIHRVVNGSNYSWDSDTDSATTFMSGGTFSVSADETTSTITASFKWSDTGDRERRQLSQQLRAIVDFSERRLRDAINANAQNSLSANALEISLDLAANLCSTNLDKITVALQQIKSKFAF